MHHHNAGSTGVDVDTSENAARAKILRVTPQLLAKFCQACEARDITRAIEFPLPADAHVYRWFIDGKSGYINLVITSTTFPVVPDGVDLPWVDPCPVIGIRYAD